MCIAVNEALVTRIAFSKSLASKETSKLSEELGMRSEGTAHKMRKRSGVLYNDRVLGHYMNGVPLPALFTSY